MARISKAAAIALIFYVEAGMTQNLGNTEEAAGVDLISYNIDSPTEFVEDGIIWKHTVSHVDAPTAFLFLYLTGLAKSPKEGWQIEISNGDETQVISPETRWAKIDGGALWTRRFIGSEATITVLAETPSAIPSFRIKSYAVPSSPTEALGIYGDTADFEDIANYPSSDLYRKLGNSVVKFTFATVNNPDVSCTGFLVARRVMMTNEHCVRSEFILSESSFVEFRYENTAENYQRTKILNVRRYDKGTVFDFATVELANDFGNSPLSFSVNEKTGSEHVTYVIQHPGGEFKKIAIKDCAILKSNIPGDQSNDSEADSDVEHSCDTLGRSSGSPVFQDGSVVALHYRSNRGDKGKPNRATRIEKILGAISAEEAELHSQFVIEN